MLTRISFFLAVSAIGIFAVGLVIKMNAHSQMPLADPVSLQKLIAGETLPIPKEESSAVFHNVPAVPPKLSELISASSVLGINTDNNSEKRIEVDLANQKVYAYEGTKKIYDFTVSTGKWGRTPTGEFHIWSKVKSQLMAGGNPGDGTYYYLPNIPWVEFFAGDGVPASMGFSFHGTYWHHNFGHPMSHGCINMQTADAKLLYDWTTPVVTNPNAWSTGATTSNPGTKVIIYGTPPEE